MRGCAFWKKRRAPGLAARLFVALGLLCLALAASPAQAKRPAAEREAPRTDARAAAMAAAWLAAPEADIDRQVVTDLAGLADRSTGTEGCQIAADALEAYFRGLKAGTTGRLSSQTPVMRHGPTFLTIDGREGELPLSPLALNAFTPGAVPQKGLSGRLVAAGRGNYQDFNGSTPHGSIALLDLDSGRN